MVTGVGDGWGPHQPTKSLRGVRKATPTSGVAFLRLGFGSPRPSLSKINLIFSVKLVGQN